MNTQHTLERYGADINGEVIYCPDGEYIYYSEYQKLEQQRDDLLARIHRDGGHYAEENGIDKAIDDAHIKVAELYLQRDEYKARCDELLALTAEMAKIITVIELDKDEPYHRREYAKELAAMASAIAKAGASNG